MKNLKDETTIEISTPDGRTSGPIPGKEFDRRVKEGLRMLKKSHQTVGADRDPPSHRGDQQPEYWRDPELDRIAKELILKYHEHLREAEISFLVTSKPMSKLGKVVLGKAQKPGGLLAYYSQADFIIKIPADQWFAADDKKKMAIVDHEICHCSVEYDKDGERHWVLVGHDVEEHTAIVDRHGLWKDDLKTFGQAAARQLELPLKGVGAKSPEGASPLFGADRDPPASKHESIPQAPGPS